MNTGIKETKDTTHGVKLIWAKFEGQLNHLFSEYLARYIGLNLVWAGWKQKWEEFTKQTFFITFFPFKF